MLGGLSFLLYNFMMPSTVVYDRPINILCFANFLVLDEHLCMYGYPCKLVTVHKTSLKPKINLDSPGFKLLSIFHILKTDF